MKCAILHARARVPSDSARARAVLAVVVPPRRFAPRVLCRQTASEAVILPACGIARTTVVGNADDPSPLPPDPGLLTEPAEPGSAPGPRAERRDAACSFTCPLPPSPAAPTKTTPAKLSWSLLHAPALSRPRCGTRTASTLDAGLCAGSAALRLPWCRASGFASRDARLFRFFCHPPLSIPALAAPERGVGGSARSAIRRKEWPPATSPCPP